MVMGMLKVTMGNLHQSTPDRKTLQKFYCAILREPIPERRLGIISLEVATLVI